MEEATPWREELIREIGRCENCGRYAASIAPHEISRGNARAASLMNRATILVLCNAPRGARPSCHDEVGGWPRARQLALLKRVRPNDYSLAEYHKVIRRKTPDEDEVDRWM